MPQVQSTKPIYSIQELKNSIVEAWVVISTGLTLGSCISFVSGYAMANSMLIACFASVLLVGLEKIAKTSQDVSINLLRHMATATCIIISDSTGLLTPFTRLIPGGLPPLLITFLVTEGIQFIAVHGLERLLSHEQARLLMSNTLKWTALFSCYFPFSVTTWSASIAHIILLGTAVAACEVLGMSLIIALATRIKTARDRHSLLSTQTRVTVQPVMAEMVLPTPTPTAPVSPAHTPPPSPLIGPSLPQPSSVKILLQSLYPENYSKHVSKSLDSLLSKLSPLPTDVNYWRQLSRDDLKADTHLTDVLLESLDAQVSSHANTTQLKVWQRFLQSQHPVHEQPPSNRV